jgi:hypothetical protein
MDHGTGDAAQYDELKSSSIHRGASPGSGLLSKFSFMRTSAETKAARLDTDEEDATQPTTTVSSSLAAITQQQRTRRRRGSLRKVALLGRGAQRESKDSKLLTIDTSHAAGFEAEAISTTSNTIPTERDALGLKVSDFTPRMTSDVPFQNSGNSRQPGSSSMTHGGHGDRDGEQRGSYNSTTDEDDVLQIPHNQGPAHSNVSLSSGSDSYYTKRTPGPRQRSFQQTKSPLSYSGISTTALPPHDSDWDYSETEWWGWVVLTVTWFVFVVGMGSCLDVWTWAWDVGKTPYAPPELENDETLPIVGYYPALIILTGVMAWVWVVVAWVGMKYFRHAKISGD